MRRGSLRTGHPDRTYRRCTDVILAELAARAGTRSLAEGETLFEQNAEAREFFVVASGRLAVRLATPPGHVIEVFDAGQYRLSGWSALVAPSVYIADAEAVEDTTVLVIPAADAEEELLREPAAGYAVMKKLAGTISVRLRDIKEGSSSCAAAEQGRRPSRPGRAVRDGRAASDP